MILSLPDYFVVLLLDDIAVVIWATIGTAAS